MKLFGRIVKDSKILKEVCARRTGANVSFRDELETCLIEVCKGLDISVPIWLKKNSFEIVNFHKTAFLKEQFVDQVNFDRFEINMEQE